MRIRTYFAIASLAVVIAALAPADARTTAAWSGAGSYIETFPTRVGTVTASSDVTIGEVGLEWMWTTADPPSLPSVPQAPGAYRDASKACASVSNSSNGRSDSGCGAVTIAPDPASQKLKVSGRFTSRPGHTITLAYTIAPKTTTPYASAGIYGLWCSTSSCIADAAGYAEGQLTISGSISSSYAGTMSTTNGGGRAFLGAGGTAFACSGGSFSCFFWG